MKKPCEIFKNALTAKPNARIKLLGDSITHGHSGTGFTEDQPPFIIETWGRNLNGYCWANKFKKFMEEKFGCSVVNNACSGTDIQFIIENFDVLVDDDDDLVICAIGTNNRHFWKKDATIPPSREEMGTIFYENVVKLYDMLKAADKTVIFMANIPASAEDEADGPDHWRILHMDDINAIYKKAAEKLDFPLISMYDLFTEYCESNNISVDSLLADGLHPNDRGYDVMYYLILKELKLC